MSRAAIARDAGLDQKIVLADALAGDHRQGLEPIGVDLARVGVQEILCEEILERRALLGRRAAPELSQHQLAGQVEIEAVADQVPERGPARRRGGLNRLHLDAERLDERGRGFGWIGLGRPRGAAKRPAQGQGRDQYDG